MSDNTSHRARLERVKAAQQDRHSEKNSRLGIWIVIGAIFLFGLSVLLFAYNLNLEQIE